MLDTGDVAVGTVTLQPETSVAGIPATVVDYQLECATNAETDVPELLRDLVEHALAAGGVRVELRCLLDDVSRVRSALGAGMRYEGVARAAHARGKAVFSRLPEDVGAAIAQKLPELPEEGLTDGVVTLRVTQPSDAAALHQEQVNLEAQRYALGTPLSEHELAEKVARARIEWLTGPDGLMTIVDTRSGLPAGKLTLRSVVPPGVADVGYGVLPAFRGRGFAARALRLIAPWALDRAGYSRLELGSKPGNRASVAVAIAGGFLPDGTRAGRLRNLDGSFDDEVHFAVTRDTLDLSVKA